MKLSILITTLTLTVLASAVALQNQRPHTRPPSFCGWTKPFPNTSIPNCKYNPLSANCLSDNQTCTRMLPFPDAMVLSVVSECSCDFYEE